MAVDGDGARAAAATSKSALLAVGMWTDSTVRLYALPTLQELTRVQLGLEMQTQARDVLLVGLGDAPPQAGTGTGAGAGADGADKAAAGSGSYLMVGLGDGTLITFVLDLSAGLPALTSRRKVVLGTHPISLTLFANAGAPCVFAACDRPTVVYSRSGKLIFSVVNIPEVTGMAPFHSELFPECLALSSEVGLMIGMVDEIQKLHVQTYPLGESPSKIAHSAQYGVYVVTSERTVTTDRGPVSGHRVQFFDESSMQQLFHYDLDVLEQGISCAVVVFEGAAQEYFVVGTAHVVPEEHEPSKVSLFLLFLWSPPSEHHLSLSSQTPSDRRPSFFFSVSVCGRRAGCWCSKSSAGAAAAATATAAGCRWSPKKRPKAQCSR